MHPAAVPCRRNAQKPLPAFYSEKRLGEEVRTGSSWSSNSAEAAQGIDGQGEVDMKTR
jgi:hypothetical protein